MPDCAACELRYEGGSALQLDFRVQLDECFTVFGVKR
jgi:hypothetical protein